MIPACVRHASLPAWSWTSTVAAKGASGPAPTLLDRMRHVGVRFCGAGVAPTGQPQNQTSPFPAKEEAGLLRTLCPSELPPGAADFHTLLLRSGRTYSLQNIDGPGRGKALAEVRSGGDWYLGGSEVHKC